MKKIMIAAAIVCAAVASQAATVVWMGTGDTVYAGNSTDVVADMSPAYLILSSYSQSDLVAAYAANNGDKAATIAAAGAAVLDEGYTVSGMAITENLPTYGETAFQAYLAIFDTDKMYVSVLETAADDGVDHGTTYINFNDFSSSQNEVLPATSYSGSGWYNAVPEPTSGLLLLLGVAGLALRRRRA